MDDRVLALCELSNDLVFQKIPRERLAYYVDASLAAGRDAAEQFRGRDVGEVYRERGVAIDYAGSGKSGYGVILRGQSVMSKEGCRVEVYRDSINELAAHSAWEGGALTPEEATQAHLAHELFHIWEYQEGRSIVQELEPVVSASLLGWKRKSHVNRCCEVAAHAFAKELLGLPVLPNFYDYLYLIRTGKMDQEAFDGMIERMTALLDSASRKDPCDKEG